MPEFIRLTKDDAIREAFIGGKRGSVLKEYLGYINSLRNDKEGLLRPDG